MRPEDLKRQRAAQEVLGRLITPMIGMKWAPFELEGMNAAWVRPERSYDRNHAILYCHGGGYTSGNLGYSRPLASKLSGVTGWDTLSFEYRLAPEHPFPAAVDDAMKAWDHLMRQGYGARDVTVAGDSAGGNLALVLCHRLKQESRRLPARLILMSPWTDMTASGKSYTERAELDPTITLDYIRAVRGAYARDQELTSPCCPPLFRGFPGLPAHTDPGGGATSCCCPIPCACGTGCRRRGSHAGWRSGPTCGTCFRCSPSKKAGQAMASVGRFLLEYT